MGDFLLLLLAADLKIGENLSSDRRSMVIAAGGLENLGT
jgi:hypothetical protein